MSLVAIFERLSVETGPKEIPNTKMLPETTARAQASTCPTSNLVNYHGESTVAFYPFHISSPNFGDSDFHEHLPSFYGGEKTETWSCSVRCLGSQNPNY